MAAEADTDVGTTKPVPPRSAAAVVRRLRSHAVRRLGWGVADQIVSSLTNFAVSIYVVHALGAVQFGAFSLAYVTYGFALNASRGLATDPLMVRFSGTDLPTWRRAVAGCTGTAVVVGLVIGACVLAAAAIFSGAAASGFLALGLTLPGLLLQDSWRYSFFALGRGSQAFVNDTVWALTLLPALAGLRVMGHANVFWFVFAWGITATIAAAVGSWQARVIPRPAGTWGWVSQHRDLGPRYLAEGTSQSAAVQIRAYSIGLILGLAALGAVQAAATLFGPMTILFLGMSLVTIPEAARVLRRSPRHLSLFCLLITGGLSVAGLAWGFFLLIAVPRGFGSWLLGPIWRSTYPLILPQMLFVIGQGIGFGVGTGLHALGAARRSLRQVVLGAVLLIIGSVVGAVVGGATGTVWGAAVTPWINAAYGWWQLRVAQREASHLPAGQRFWSIRLNRRHRSKPARAAASWPDVPTPGGAVKHDPALEAGVSSAASAMPSLPSTSGKPATDWRIPDNDETIPLLQPSTPAQRTRRVTMPVAAARALLVTGGLALAALVATAGWKLAHEPAGTHRTANAQARTSATAQAPTITPAHARPHMLKPVSAVSFDPYGDGQGENSQLASLAIDATPATPWHTEWYASASFENLKPGTGLLLDMGRTVTITSVRLLLGSMPGADFQLRIGNATSSLTDLAPVAGASDAGGQVFLQLTRPAHGRYVLIWFIQLPPDTSGTFQASVYNVTLKGWR
jgi:O-antigen/teichoic acid export membrane protein